MSPLIVGYVRYGDAADEVGEEFSRDNFWIGLFRPEAGHKTSPVGKSWAEADKFFPTYRVTIDTSRGMAVLVPIHNQKEPQSGMGVFEARLIREAPKSGDLRCIATSNAMLSSRAALLSHFFPSLTCFLSRFLLITSIWFTDSQCDGHTLSPSLYSSLFPLSLWHSPVN